MANEFKTPGVYVKEISTLPPSVVEVSTAVPAFIGNTDQGPPIARISSLLDYEQLFGKAVPTPFEVTTTKNADGVETISVKPVGDGEHPLHQMHYCLQMFFANGGGSCYVVRADDNALAGKEGYDNALTLLRKEDEPTLVVLVDALSLGSGVYHSLCISVLDHCAKLGDRFAILDVGEFKDVSGFREGVGLNNLKYGAAYVPGLQTSISHHYIPEEVTIKAQDGTDGEGVTLKSIESTQTGLYNQIRAELDRQWVVLPPAAAVAGIYAQVDRTRGVWKAPANVSVASVIGPAEKIGDNEQGDLNVDAGAGKSINAIRSFAGKGTLVWGARTLAGDSNDWRYVPVRRLFIMIEESARKSTSFAVFEPNDATTWLKVKGMIESFLYSLWERGALAGPTPEGAYFVEVGLGKTMSTDDVLRGRMIIRIGVATVRPAEFIILQFTHRLPEV